MRLPSRLGATAHYTAEIWYRHGLSEAALTTRTGALLYQASRPLNWAYAARGHRTLETLLLVRHHALDRALERAVESGRVGQVVEVAAGLSPRGLRFARRYPEVVYIDTDLAPMAEHKRRLLDSRRLPPNYRIATLDATADAGPASLSTLAEGLQTEVGLALVTEGLLPYFDRDATDAMWRRFAASLARFRYGSYLSDIQLASDIRSARASGILRALIRTLTRRRVRTHFHEPAQAQAALREAGFSRCTVHAPTDLDVHLDGSGSGNRRPVVRVIEARIE